MDQTGRRFREVLENRSDVLDYLVTSPATKPTLVDDLPLSRSTVDRAISDLTEIGCVTEDDGTYTSTTTGRMALAEYEQYRSTTEAIQEATTFLNHLSSDDPIDTRFLEGAQIDLPKPHVPDYALTSSIELLNRSTSMKVIAPVTLTVYPTFLIDQIESGEFTAEIVGKEEVFEALPELLGSNSKPLNDYDDVSLYQTDANIPYSLWIMETPEQRYAGISAYDNGGVAGVLINDSQEAIEWAEEKYHQYRDTAHPYTERTD